MIDDDVWTNRYRLVSEMIDTKVLKPISPILADKEIRLRVFLKAFSGIIK